MKFASDGLWLANVGHVTFAPATFHRGGKHEPSTATIFVRFFWYKSYKFPRTDLVRGICMCRLKKLSVFNIIRRKLILKLQLKRYEPSICHFHRSQHALKFITDSLTLRSAALYIISSCFFAINCDDSCYLSLNTIERHLDNTQPVAFEH